METALADATTPGRSPRPGPRSPRPRSKLPFASAIGLSAFLLFCLELLAGRLVLPVFGGSPAVWATSLCFFTAVLFVGYLLRARPRVAAAGVARRGRASRCCRRCGRGHAPGPVEPGRAPQRRPCPRRSTSSSPSRWSRAGRRSCSRRRRRCFRRGSRIAAATRGGSMRRRTGRHSRRCSPIRSSIEPNVPLSAQRLLFAVGLVVMITLLAAVVAGARLRRARRATRRTSVTAPDAVDRPDAGVVARSVAVAAPAHLGRRRQALWLAAAFVPAGLLSATTNYLQTDLISAPLIWVGPLAIYLASFVVAFSERGRRWVRAQSTVSCRRPRPSCGSPSCSPACGRCFRCLPSSSGPCSCSRSRSMAISPTTCPAAAM